MGTINLTAPTCYAEMTESQTRYVAELLIRSTEEEKIWIKCFIKFTGIRPVLGNSSSYYFTKKGLKGFFYISYEEILSFSKKLDFTTKNYEGIRPPAKIGQYHSCDELLRDTIFAQYIDAENYYQQYIFTEDKEALHNLMATLFRRKGEKYTNDLSSSHIRRMKKSSEADKQMTLMWFIGLKKSFTHTFKYLFETVENSDGTYVPDMVTIVHNQMRMLTSGDVTKEEKVLEASTWSALSELNDQCREIKNLKPETQNY